MRTDVLICGMQSACVALDYRNMHRNGQAFAKYATACITKPSKHSFITMPQSVQSAIVPEGVGVMFPGTFPKGNSTWDCAGEMAKPA